MKRYFLLLLSLSILAFAGCKKPEKILTMGDGLWDIKSSRSVIYNDGAVVSDITLTDTLGQMYFNADGTAWVAFFDHSHHDEIVWEVNESNDALVTYFVGIPDEVHVLPLIDLEKDRFALQETTTSQISFTSPPYVRYVESTMILQRVE